MQTGVVKWFNNAKGYGFVLADENGKDVFAHYSAIDVEGYRTLRAGQCVAFDSIEGPKGLHAVSIKILDDAPVLGQNQRGQGDTAADTNTTQRQGNERSAEIIDIASTANGDS